MTFTEQVRQAICDKGRASADDIKHLFPDHTRKQVMQAVNRCVRKGWLVCDGHRRASGIGRSNAIAGTYRPSGVVPIVNIKLRLVPPASVWDLAGDKKLAEWPPRFDGGREFPLLGPSFAELLAA